MSAIEVQNISKHFGGVYAVAGLSLTIERGRITSIVGPNGSGKTTLTNLLSGIFPWDSGTLVVEGDRLLRLAAHEGRVRGIARTFQHVRLFEQMSVYENLLLVMSRRTIVGSLLEQGRQAMAGRAQELLEHVGLWGKRDAQAGTLSYGQRKLLEIARVLAQDAKVVIFDEPFAGLFPKMIDMLCDVMQCMRKEGRAVVLIEHNMKIVRALSDEVVVMDAGKLLAHGLPNAVLERKDVREAYLGV